jgi:YbbR domain-containing protein
MAKVSDKDFSAVVDWADVTGPGNNTLVLAIESRAQNVEIAKASQDAIKVALDSVEDRSFTLQARLEGTPAPGYRIIRSTLPVDTIVVNGLSSVLDLVDRADVVVNTDGISRDATVDRAVVFLDSTGAEIAQLKGKYTAQVRMETARQVDVAIATAGELPAQFHDYATAAVPENVWIVGPYETVSALASIETEPVNIANLTGDATVDAKLIVPDGISLYESPDTVKVTVTLVAYTSIDVTIAMAQIGIVNDQSATYDAEILTSEIVVGLTGLKTDLDQVTVEKLSPAINVSSLTEGTHNVSLSLLLPSGVQQKSNYFVLVKITKK